ncbi:MAG TPA: RNA polymerase sigma-70 factor [Puia sp.]|nr:RNA polymerase sigma-70 factor [Puia sp.]
MNTDRHLSREHICTDQLLLQRLSAGDKLAFQQLFEQYWDHVYTAGLRLTKSPEQAKDLAQDIFLKLWDNRSRLAGVKQFSAYLYTIIRNLVHDQIRTQIFHESNREFLVNYFSYQDCSPEERLERKQLMERLNAAIARLSPKLREVFILSRFDGLSHEEIAQRLHITPLSSKTYIVRALVTLRKLMGERTEILLLLLFGLMVQDISASCFPAW